MTAPSDPARADILALLELHHGVGLRGAQGETWLTQRLDTALAELARTHDLRGAALLDLLRADRGELARLADVLRVGETMLYRDPAQWEALARHLRERVRVAPGGRLRGISVGCATGEEAWTLAMVLDSVAVKGWRVLGLDRSAAALEVARRAVYPEERARALPAELRSRYVAVHGPGTIQLEATLGAQVSFVHRDATQGLPPGSYEVVVCKNVLIYFGDKAGERLVTDLLRAVAPGGVLLVARSEVPRLRALGHPARDLGGGVTAFEPSGRT